MKWLPISIYYFLQLFAFRFCLTTKYNSVSLASTSGTSTPFPIYFSTNDLSLLDCALSFMLPSLPLLVIHWPTQLKYIAYLPILLTYRSLKESECKMTIFMTEFMSPRPFRFSDLWTPPFFIPYLLDILSQLLSCTNRLNKAQSLHIWYSNNTVVQI